MEWHQNHSALVVPKVAEKVLLEGAPIRETVENWPDIMDFMLRVKVPRSSSLVIEYRDNGTEQQFPLQNTTRYLITKDGGRLFKVMPPIKSNPNWRQIGVEAGWKVTPCNDIKDAGESVIDFDWYVQEVEKLVNGLS
mgnify:CR=1 FL=1